VGENLTRDVGVEIQEECKEVQREVGEHKQVLQENQGYY